MPPRYPVSVRLHTENPLAVVSATRYALRRAGTDRREIERFTEEAIAAEDHQRLLSLCREWVWVESPC